MGMSCNTPKVILLLVQSLNFFPSSNWRLNEQHHLPSSGKQDQRKMLLLMSVYSFGFMAAPSSQQLLPSFFYKYVRNMYLNLRYEKKKIKRILFPLLLALPSLCFFTDFNKSCSYYSFQMVSLFYLCVCVHMGFLRLADGFSSPQHYGQPGNFFILFWFRFCLKSKACQSSRLLLRPRKG